VKTRGRLRLPPAHPPTREATSSPSQIRTSSPPGQEPVDDPRVQTIASAANELVEKRNRWLNPEGADEAEVKKRTLTNLYNQRPTWLDLVHKKLDEAVHDAYAWPYDISDEEILERLLALNLERASTQRPAGGSK